MTGRTGNAADDAAGYRGGLDVRPRRAAWVGVVAAVLLVAVFTTIALLLRNTPTGVFFNRSDQVSMVLLGVLLAAAALLFARPRLRTGPDGVEVRNLLGTQRFAWPLVVRVRFPDGAPWARLDLPDDEYVAVMAIQAADKQHAVTALRRLREEHAAHTGWVRGA